MRRLLHRLPVRLRHHWKLPAAFAAFLLVLGLVAGTVRITPIVASGGSEVEAAVAQDVAGREDLWDASAPHTISVSYDATAYDEMLDDYFDDDEKTWIKADVVIDGTTIQNAGLRLKGNSTLRGLKDARPGAKTTTRQQGPGGRGGFGGMTNLSTDKPADLPWLIDFGKYEEGRTYQGLEQLSVRPAAQGSELSVNEALALSLVAESGEPSQRYAYSSFTVNGGRAATRLVVQHPDEEYASSLGDGVLYKALATGAFSYQGDDLTEYTDDFKQINKTGSQDLTPVIRFLKWLDSASDEEFAAHLADHVDVESFAKYAALQNLLLNFDDMAGPGKNFYLWYDLGSGKLRVITWDLNFAFSGDTALKPGETASMGGGMMRPGGQQGQQDQQGQRPEMPEGGPPEGFPQQGGQEGRGGGMRMGNTLKTKFLAAEAFKDDYEQAYRELYRTLYADGAATTVLDALEKVVGAGQVTRLRETVEARTKALASDPVITGG
ncbi:CotH kinase family protein [Nonomuraea soli]|uniref:Spore coat protein CotH n=1 Tax=Nonomuraea soli TaxID=1032476 RepID=A0A7W0CF99_9ACTN|nr:CotH kinase family protein [Nonomuraea soli]MBA2889895.1 spore coat protein CotH [Nonomuraea soli]